MTTERKKERYLVLSLKLYPTILENLIGHSLDSLELEKYDCHCGRSTKIDLCAVSKKNNVPVFLEAQLNVSDTSHLKKVLHLIEKKEGVVIWLASGFDEKHIQKVKETIKRYNKFVDLYLVKYIEEVGQLLEYANKIPKKKAYNHLKKIQSISGGMKVYDTFINIPSNYVGAGNIPLPSSVTHKFEEMKKYTQEELCKAVPELYSLHTSRKSVPERVLKVSSGVDGIAYHCSPNARGGKLYVKLYYSKKNDPRVAEVVNYLQHLFPNTYYVKVSDDHFISFELTPHDLDLEERVKKVVELFIPIYTYCDGILERERYK